MKYMFYRPAVLYRKGTLRTRDGVVTQASNSFKWAIGKRIGPVLEWATEKGFRWRVTED